MTRRTVLHRATAAGLIAAAALVTAIACRGTDNPASPINPSAANGSRREGVGEQGDHDPRGNAWGQTPKPIVCTDRKPAVESGVFGPSGGTLLFGDSRLIIPGGALRSDVTITATVRGGTSSQVDFEPHGLRFEKPVGLALDAASCAVPEDGMPSIVYVDDAGAVLETIPARYVPQWKAVAAPIEHFSGYAIAFAR